MRNISGKLSRAGCTGTAQEHTVIIPLGRRATNRAAIRQDVLAKMEAAIAFADASPEPTPEDLFKNLYV